jgi:hypothetical protein
MKEREFGKSSIAPITYMFRVSFSLLYLVVIVRRIVNSRMGPEDAFLLSTLALVLSPRLCLPF